MSFDYSQPHKMVNGIPILLTQSEITAWQAESAGGAALANHAAALQQIHSLEMTVTARRLREAMLGMDGGWLANVNSQITTLRGQL